MAEKTDGQVTDQSITDGQVIAPKVHTFSDEELATYIANIQKEKYETGKKAGVEMLFKKLKTDLNIDNDNIKDFNGLLDNVLSLKTESYTKEIETLKNQLSGEQKSIVEKYEAEKSNLQKMLIETENLMKATLSAKEQELYNFKTDLFISNEINSLSFDAPMQVIAQGEEAVSKYVSIEKQKARVLFSNLYSFDFDGSGQLIVKKKDGEIIKDRLQNPEKLNVIMSNFDKEYNFINQSNTPPQKMNWQKQATANYKGLSYEQFEKNQIESGNDRGSNAFVLAYGDWKKSNA